MPSDRQVAVVTGAADGIGWAVTKKFADAGFAVCLLDLNIKTARQRAQNIEGNHCAYECDVSDEEQVKYTFSQIDAQYGRLDVLVNNAGIPSPHDATIEQYLAYFEKINKVVLSGTFLCSRQAYAPMVRQGRGAIVNVGSIAGIVGLPRRNAYGASKAGVLSLTRALACEWASVGIRVNAVAPGYISTALVQGLINRGSVDPARIARRIPAGRLGTPEEIAEPVYFLASENARYVTGATLSVDGGWAAFGDAGNASDVA